MKKNGVVLTISGPSCAGKTTIANELGSAEDSDFVEIISITTRPPRDGEQDGVDYHFIDDAQFKKHFMSGELFESARFGSHHYGTLEKDVEKALKDNKIPVLVVEPQGVVSTSERLIDTGAIHVPVFIEAPMHLVLERFYDRFQKDVEEGLNPSLKGFASRIYNAMGDERLWRHMLDYDGVFNATSDASETKEICRAISGLCHEPLLKRKFSELRFKLDPELPDPVLRQRGIEAISKTVKANYGKLTPEKAAPVLSRAHAKARYHASETGLDLAS